MYKIIDSKNTITELGTVDSFLGELQDKLFTNFYHIYNTYLTLDYNENTLYYKVVFSVDGREDDTFDVEIRDFVSSNFKILRNVDWVREATYQDGTARYNLFFKIKKDSKWAS